ncbi:hypothetical protein EUGRSUZ_E02415 [Eucalyptus grandis]|uniref:Uncharacterized protein n=2 Tax=Eucalyptus grandis TaxID=71139 RepID=A0ACC3KWA8_EUCGR|nr:hypothetical protein EUGRSUZ_E02415 [Eucalyptus grandis]
MTYHSKLEDFFQWPKEVAFLFILYTDCMSRICSKSQSHMRKQSKACYENEYRLCYSIRGLDERINDQFTSNISYKYIRCHAN